MNIQLPDKDMAALREALRNPKPVPADPRIPRHTVMTPCYCGAKHTLRILRGAK